MNVELIKKVWRHIKEEPLRLSGSWGIRKGSVGEIDYRQYPPCKTKACLAGWTVLLDKPKSKWPSLFSKSGVMKNHLGVKNKAACLLGLNSFQANGLFCGSWTRFQESSKKQRNGLRDAINRLFQEAGLKDRVR